MAIILAGHNPSIRLLGISTVASNQTVDKTTRNALDVLHVAGLDHIREPGCQTLGLAASQRVGAAHTTACRLVSQPDPQLLRIGGGPGLNCAAAAWPCCAPAAVVAGAHKPLLRASSLLCPEIHGDSGLDGPSGGPVLPHSGLQPLEGESRLP
jgi:inosine-uridine nucleoside N-ribohydrolase